MMKVALTEWMVGIGLRKPPAIRKTKKAPEFPPGPFQMLNSKVLRR
jgi:hypothetical protein